MKSYKTKLRRDFAIELQKQLDSYITTPVKNDTDKIIVSLFAEVSLMLANQTNVVEPQYKIKLTPAQAFALRLLHLYIHDNISYFGNRLHQIANEIHKQYS